MTGLPGVCIVCRKPVVWGGKSWREAGNRGARHACPNDRPTCGAWMRTARERCARRPGHGYEHRTRYAMDNALAMATGRRPKWDNGTVGISDASTDIMCDALLVADTSREGVSRLEVSAPMTFDVR